MTFLFFLALSLVSLVCLFITTTTTDKGQNSYAKNHCSPSPKINVQLLSGLQIQVNLKPRIPTGNKFALPE